MTERLTQFDVELIRYCRYQLNLPATRIARDLGIHVSTVRKKAPDMVPTEKLRKAFEQSEYTANQVARFLGWRSGWTSNGFPKWDVSRVRRSFEAKTIHYGKAVKLAEALGVDPVDVGL